MAVAWSEAQRVLAVRLDGAGDLLMTAPAIEGLRCEVPGRRITLLTSAAGASVATLLPAVDEVIEYHAPWMKMPRESDSSVDLELIARLRGQFDAAIIFTVYSQSPLPAALLCTLADIPLRAAVSRENPYGLLSLWVPETEPHERVLHEVDRQRELVRATGVARRIDARLEIPQTARASVRAALERHGLLDGEPWALLHPGATASSRRYLPEQWAAVVRGLAAEGVRTLLVGAEGDRADIEGITQMAGVAMPSIVGPPLPELAALIEAAPLVLAVNSLAAHLASALRTPLVELYAQTNPQHGPWNGVAHRLLTHPVACANCYRSFCPLGHHACMRNIAPIEVVRAALDLCRGVHTSEP